MPIIAALWEAEAGRLLELRSLRLTWETGQEFISTKSQTLQNLYKISWAWWCTPVVLATEEAKVQGLLEPGGRNFSEQ